MSQHLIQVLVFILSNVENDIGKKYKSYPFLGDKIQTKA